MPGLFSMSELGAVVLNQRRDTFYVRLKPLPGAGFDPRAVAVAGPGPEQLERDGRDAREATVEFADWIARQKEPGRRTVMASFGTFDWMWVSWYLHRFVQSNPFGPNGLDIKSFAAGLQGRHYTRGQVASSQGDPGHPRRLGAGGAAGAAAGDGSSFNQLAGWPLSATAFGPSLRM